MYKEPLYLQAEVWTIKVSWQYQCTTTDTSESKQICKHVKMNWCVMIICKRKNNIQEKRNIKKKYGPTHTHTQLVKIQEDVAWTSVVWSEKGRTKAVAWRRKSWETLHSTTNLCTTLLDQLLLSGWQYCDLVLHSQCWQWCNSEHEMSNWRDWKCA